MAKEKDFKMISKKTQIPFEKVRSWFLYQRRIDYESEQKCMKEMKVDNNLCKNVIYYSEKV